MKQSSIFNLQSSNKAARRSGFTVLFATLIAALLLAVGLAIFDIIFKEVSFAITVRDSNYAIYAADTGAECAEYWDNQCTAAGLCPSSSSAFATSTNSSAPTSGLVCGGEDLYHGTDDQQILNSNGFPPSIPIPEDALDATTTFALYLSPQQPGVPPYCAIVEVIKNVNPSTNAVSTAIISRGYNTCDPNNPNRIERAYIVNY